MCGTRSCRAAYPHTVNVGDGKRSLANFSYPSTIHGGYPTTIPLSEKLLSKHKVTQAIPTERVEIHNSGAIGAGPPHLSQLDGLRAFAVMAVVYTHYVPEKYWALGIYWGGYGVRLFFVLSGFLITGILLRSRQFIAYGQRPSFALRQFYVRRFLRIFPLYYVTLAIAVILAIPPVRATVLWNLSYLSNVYFARLGQFDGLIGHLWSLSVEEQFYLFWPCLIFFVPSRFLLPSIVGGVAAAPLFRVIGKILGASDVALWVLTPASLDSLCLGALLAYIGTEEDIPYISRKTLCRFFLMLGLPLTCSVEILSLFAKDSLIVWFAGDLGRGLIFTWVVAGAADGFGGIAGKTLTCRPMLYIGKISYGVYLLHPFIPWLCFKPLSVAFRASSPVLVCAYTAITIAVASLSWEIFEKRVNNLKRYFQYDEIRTPGPIRSLEESTDCAQR
jgi:peptidoglycan/LPS O-acetylase OafA/YrhL